MNLFSNDFMTRDCCGNWDYRFKTLYIISHLIITVSFLLIPLAMYVNRKYLFEKYKAQSKITNTLFILFTSFCGLGHLEGILAFYYPYYHLFTIWHCLTAVLSGAAVIWMFQRKHG